MAKVVSGQYTYASYLFHHLYSASAQLFKPRTQLQMLAVCMNRMAKFQGALRMRGIGG